MTPRTVLITGASSGIGAATALACAAAGYRVALAARRVERLQEVAAAAACPDRLLVIPSDVRDPVQVRAMAATAEAALGPIEVLVANAGVGRTGEEATAEEAPLLEQVEVNLLGVIRSIRAVLPGMVHRGQGHVLVVASVAAEVPMPGNAVYAATKAGILAYAEALRREVQPRGVHVSTLLPGFIESEMTAGVPLRMPPASLVGATVVRLLRRPRARTVVPRYYCFPIWLNRLAPGVVDAAARRILPRLLHRDPGPRH